MKYTSAAVHVKIQRHFPLAEAASRNTKLKKYKAFGGSNFGFHKSKEFKLGNKQIEEGGDKYALWRKNSR